MNSKLLKLKFRRFKAKHAPTKPKLKFPSKTHIKKTEFIITFPANNLFARPSHEGEYALIVNELSKIKDVYFKNYFTQITVMNVSIIIYYLYIIESKSPRNYLLVIYQLLKCPHYTFSKNYLIPKFYRNLDHEGMLGQIMHLIALVSLNKTYEKKILVEAFPEINYSSYIYPNEVPMKLFLKGFFDIKFKKNGKLVFKIKDDHIVSLAGGIISSILKKKDLEILNNRDFLKYKEEIIFVTNLANTTEKFNVKDFYDSTLLESNIDMYLLIEKVVKQVLPLKYQKFFFDSFKNKDPKFS